MSVWRVCAASEQNRSRSRRESRFPFPALFSFFLFLFSIFLARYFFPSTSFYSPLSVRSLTQAHCARRRYFGVHFLLKLFCFLTLCAPLYSSTLSLSKHLQYLVIFRFFFSHSSILFRLFQLLFLSSIISPSHSLSPIPTPF